MKRRRFRTEKLRKGIYLIPNLCTTASLFLGFFAIIRAAKGEYIPAAWSILLAGLFDMFDGSLARLTRHTSQFGIEYDSLCDLISFGVAPAFLMHQWALHGFGRIGAMAAFLFAACGALRLARFNVQMDKEEAIDFQGLPIPMAAYMLATTIIFYKSIFKHITPIHNEWLIGLTLLLSVLMVSTFCYRSLKHLELKRYMSFALLVSLVSLLVVVATRPQVSLWCFSIAYILSAPIEGLVRLVLRRPAQRRVKNKKEEITDEKVRLLRSGD